MSSAAESEIPLCVLSDNSEDSVSENPKRAKKHFADLSPEEEQVMVEWLESHPIVYNKKLTAYKDVGKKERLWREKASEMQKPVKLLKIWYTSVRSRYGRLKKKSGNFTKDLTEREQWILQHFDFLRPFIYEVKKRTGRLQNKKLASSPKVPDLEVKVEPTPTIQQQMETPEPTQTTSPAPEAPEPLSDLQMRPHRPIVNHAEPSDDHERETFISWARAVVQQLEYPLWRRCQRDMSEILCRYIAENDLLRWPSTEAFSAANEKMQPRHQARHARNVVATMPDISESPTTSVDPDMKPFLHASSQPTTDRF